jgi:hypothetical protein
MGVADQSRVQLPTGADGAIEVYVNGVRQLEEVDFDRGDGELIFRRRLTGEGRLGFWRWLSLFFGVAGTYRQNDSVDVVYEVDGRRTVVTGLPILETQPIPDQASTGEEH